MNKSIAFCQLLKRCTRGCVGNGIGTTCSSESSVSRRHVIELHQCNIFKRTQGCKRFCTATEPEQSQDEHAGGSEILGEWIADPVPETRTNPITEMPYLKLKFKTEDNDPTHHTIEDDGKFYEIPSEEYKKYIKDGQWYTFHKQVKAFQECAVMVRQPALELFGMIENLNLKLPPARFIFYGKQGHGKTLTLAHVVHRYAKAGWLTIHFPDVRQMISFNPRNQREHVKSSYNNSRYDLTEDAAKWLQYFKAQNTDLLSLFTTSKEYTWSERNSTPAGTSLLEVIDLGMERIKFASDIIGVIFKEIKAQASEKNVKVLVAVDGINVLWKDVSSITDEKKQLIKCQELSLFHHLRKLHEPTWTGGVCVSTVCPSVDALDNYLNASEVPYTPQYLLKPQGFYFMDPFIPILVPEFTMREAYNFVDYLIHKSWIQRPRGKTHEGKKELIILSNRSPQDLMRLSAIW